MSEQEIRLGSKVLRALTIARVALHYFVLYRLTSAGKKRLGERLRVACQTLGITYIKVGQVLSGRYDLLSEEDLSELKKLLDQADPIPETLAYEIIREELGTRATMLGPLTLLSSASIAQVYAAALDMKPVVIKVLRPGIRAQVALDLAVLHWLIQVANLLSPSFRRLRANQAIGDMRKSIAEETDLSLELCNIELFRTHLAQMFGDGPVRKDLGRLLVPKTYSEFSTSKVLVMERFEGVTINDWLRGIRPKDEASYEAPNSLMTFFVGSLRPIFDGRGSMYHGDPHPANIMILQHGDVGLIDFGLTVKYDEAEVQSGNKLFFGIYLKNAEITARAILEQAELPESCYELILPDVKAYVASAEKYGFGQWMYGVSHIIRKHKLSSPVLKKDDRPNHHGYTMRLKFVLLVDSLAHEFFPDRTTADLLGPELEAGIVSRITYNFQKTDPKVAILSLAYAVSEVIAEGPELVGKVLNRFL